MAVNITVFKKIIKTFFFFLLGTMNQLGVLLIGNVFATSYSLITDLLPCDLLGHSDQPH